MAVTRRWHFSTWSGLQDFRRGQKTSTSDCQTDWTKLRDAMIRRFPGPVLSGGIVVRSPTQWDQSGVPTPAQPPPTTTSKIAVTPPRKVSQEAKQGSNIPVTKESHMTGLFRRISLDWGSREDPQITVSSFIIELTQGGTAQRPLTVSLEARVNLHDLLAVQSAKEKPLITVKESDVKNYRVGFTYCLNYGATSIGAQHKVLWPRKLKTSYKSHMCQALSMTPEREAVLYHPLAVFLYYHGQPCPTVDYTIQSFFQQSSARRCENLADITWIINVA